MKLHGTANFELHFGNNKYSSCVINYWTIELSNKLNRLKVTANHCILCFAYEEDAVKLYYLNCKIKLWMMHFSERNIFLVMRDFSFISVIFKWERYISRCVWHLRSIRFTMKPILTFLLSCQRPVVLTLSLNLTSTLTFFAKGFL